MWARRDLPVTAENGWWRAQDARSRSPEQRSTLGDNPVEEGLDTQTCPQPVHSRIARSAACGPPVDGMGAGAPGLGTGTPRLWTACGQRIFVHSGGAGAPSRVHGPCTRSEGSWAAQTPAVHSVHRPYEDDEIHPSTYPAPSTWGAGPACSTSWRNDRSLWSEPGLQPPRGALGSVPHHNDVVPARLHAPEGRFLR